MDNYTLCERLLKAESEQEVEAALKAAGYFAEDPNTWQPFGGFSMNLNQINNQQSDATAALVEKVINSIDAVLLAECYRNGIDPKGSHAPKTMAEAVEKLFGVKEGRLENLSPTERTKLAARIHFVATGSKREPCYLVIDSGEGQTANTFKDTFLSLTKQNKDEIPFVQGRFNCGGTGVLPFCGEHNYQLIISRRQPTSPTAASDATKNQWAFTVVRRQPPAPGRKSSMYVYLAPGGSIPTFDKAAISVLPGASGKNSPASAYAVDLSYGTCIKLYNYGWKKKTLVTTDGRYELERFLHSVPVPFRISETRDYKANYYSTTLSGILADLSDEGEQQAESTSKFETGLGPAYGELNLPGVGRLQYRLFLLKDGYDTGNFPHGVYFTLNGQVHGDLPANFIHSTLKFDFLSRSLLVSVDCTQMEAAVREKFMMASRDRVRRNEIYDSIFAALREELREHPGLKQHNAQRRKKLLDDTLSKDENANDYFQELLKADPTLASLLGLGGNLISTIGPTQLPTLFKGKKFPSVFQLAKEPKGGLIKACALNRTARIEFETDAENGYFDRTDSPGKITIEPPDLCVASHLWDGRFTARFQVPYDAKVGDTVQFKVTVDDVQTDATGKPFVSTFTLKASSETEDTQPGPSGQRQRTKPQENGKGQAPALAAPDIREVHKDKWPEFQFDDYSAVKVTNGEGGKGYIFFVNMDNRFLINELHKAKQEDGPLVKHWFKYGVVLGALGLIKEMERLEQLEAKKNGGEPKAVELLEISRLCGGFARVVVPIIRALYKGPSALENAAAKLAA